MRTGRPKPALVLSAEEHAQLSGLAASRSLPHALVARAKAVLWSAQGETKWCWRLKADSGNRSSRGRGCCAIFSLAG